MMTNVTKILIAILALSSFFHACTNPQKEKEDNSVAQSVSYPIEFNLDTVRKGGEHNYLSSVFKPDVKTVLLETNDAALIGIINKLRVYDGYLIVMDRMFSKKIYVFDMDGKFIHTISGPGSGPGEYSSLSDFTVDEASGEVLVLDWNQNIMRFRIATGQYQRGKDVSIKVEESTISTAIELLNGKLYADVYCYVEKDDTPLLREFDVSTGKQVQTFFNLKEYNRRSHRHLMSSFPFKKYADGSLLFFHSYMNTVIRIDENGVYPFVSVKSRDIITTDELKQYDLDNPLDDFSIKMLSVDKIQGICFCYTYTDHIYLSCLRGVKLSPTFSYNTGRNRIDYTNYPVDDLVYRKEDTCMFDPAFGNDKGMYRSVSGLSFPGFIKNIASGMLNPDVDRKKELQELTEDSNPVIFYYEYED
jgi:hypothetical protein